jgi:hypothetical protein
LRNPEPPCEQSDERRVRHGSVIQDRFHSGVREVVSHRALVGGKPSFEFRDLDVHALRWVAQFK